MKSNPVWDADDIPALTGLRFLAAFLILCNHLLLGYVARENAYIAPGLERSGLLGMDIFFILSGFIIHYKYGPSLAVPSRESILKFFLARFARLYPLYILVITADVVLSLFLKEVSLRDCWQALPYLLTATQSWFYISASSGALYAQFLPRASLSWSISTEFFLYLTYPFVAYVLARDQVRPAIRLGVLAALIILLSLGATRLWQVLVIENAQHGYSAPFAFWLAFISPYRRFAQFLIGALIAHLVVRKSNIPQWIHDVTLIVALGYIGFSFLPKNQVPHSIQVIFNTLGTDVAVAFLVFSLATKSDGFFSRILSYAPIVRLGELSYSIYLLQFFVLTVVINTLGTANPVVPKIVIDWLVLFVLSAISYRLVERPLRSAIRRAVTRSVQKTALPRDVSLGGE